MIFVSLSLTQLVKTMY